MNVTIEKVTNVLVLDEENQEHSLTVHNGCSDCHDRVFVGYRFRTKYAGSKR